MERRRNHRRACFDRSCAFGSFHSPKILGQRGDRDDQGSSNDPINEACARDPEEILGRTILVPGVFRKHNWSWRANHPAICPEARIKGSASWPTWLWLLKSPLWGRRPLGWNPHQSHRLCRWIIYLVNRGRSDLAKRKAWFLDRELDEGHWAN